MKVVAAAADKSTAIKTCSTTHMALRLPQFSTKNVSFMVRNLQSTKTFQKNEPRQECTSSSNKVRQHSSPRIQIRPRSCALGRCWQDGINRMIKGEALTYFTNCVLTEGTTGLPPANPVSKSVSISRPSPLIFKCLKFHTARFRTTIPTASVRSYQKTEITISSTRRRHAADAVLSTAER